MFARLGNFVSRFPLLIMISWLALLLLLRLVAPEWDQVAHDGDMAYLPPSMPSAVGERLLEEAFTYQRAKSQIVLVAAREERPLTRDDVFVATDLIRRFYNIEGASSLRRAEELRRAAAERREAGEQLEAERLENQAADKLIAAADALDEAIYRDAELADYWKRRQAGPRRVAPSLVPQRLAAAYHNRALVAEQRGNSAEAETLKQQAAALDPQLADRGRQVAPEGADEWPLLDVWTWNDEVFGEKLISEDEQARLIVLQLSNEFMATDNIRVLAKLESQLAEVRQGLEEKTRPGLRLEFSGSAAVGGDMLRAAADSIKNTELATVLLVMLILAVVYRSPLLVAVPLISIGVSLMVATRAVALLTQLHHVPGFGWWDLKVFTTTKIFIVVILFGAGTDYCLFLISRYREELAAGYGHVEAVGRALAGVGDALAASALTTIFGLATMFFADFGKFRYSGPVIGLCLVVTLLACITFTPALLRSLGTAVFWPFGLPPAEEADERTRAGGGNSRFGFLWNWVARYLVAYPGRILIISTILLFPLAAYALRLPYFSPPGEVLQGTRITYDILGALGPDRPSKRGAELLRQHFAVGESGPLTVLVYQHEGPDLDTPEGRTSIRKLTDALYVEGVKTVRSIADPLGEYPHGKYPGVVSKRAVRLRVLRAHPRIEALFLAQSPDLAGKVTRLDLILHHDPFSAEARQVLARLDTKLHALAETRGSEWHGARFAYSGITASIRDLRAVTQSDESRIMVLVVLAVLLVLLVILKRPLVCLYMILSVLFSYYVTIGATELFFRWAYGDTFQGLDWKVPLFLFVILVAIGQDYNVYLATRVFEEQQKYGPFAGLRRAVVRTGGIITSCGVIMAGTFFSMTSGTWLPVIGEWIPAASAVVGTSSGPLRGIVELGFALSLGVMLDTFVVRPLLVPAFLALLCRWQARRGQTVAATAVEP